MRLAGDEKVMAGNCIESVWYLHKRIGEGGSGSYMKIEGKALEGVLQCWCAELEFCREISQLSAGMAMIDIRQASE